jgi:RNA polymerase sigma factor (sigma-70 family)
MRGIEDLSEGRDMAKSAVDMLLRQLRALASGQAAEGGADQHLLERFARQRDEAAFAAFLERHGTMVLGVCRRALHDDHLAEDVFQATFLVLARNASRIRKRTSLGSWLHGVAVRLARKARAETARARRGDARPAPEPPPGPAAEATWREVRQILDEELQRLPDCYCLPLVLCYLEGRTRDEAAAALGWTPGRLKGLLERGRERLRRRLIRRGLAPAAAGAALLAETALAAPVPSLLAVATLRAALRLAAGELFRACGVSGTVIRLTEGGVGIMGSKKILLVLVLALGLGVLGTGLLAQRSGPAASAEGAEGAVLATPPRRPPEKGKAPADKPADDRKAIQGLWRVESILVNGKDWDDELGRQQKKARWRITGDSFEIEIDVDGKKVIYAAHSYTIDPTRTPRTWDTFPLPGPGVDASKRQQAGVYALTGDTLKICFGTGGKGDGGEERPKDVSSTEGSRTLLYTLKRVQPNRDKSGDGQEAAWREKAVFTNVAPQPENWWKPGGLFPAFVQFSPDGKRLVAGRWANLQTFALLDLAAGKDVTCRSISEDNRSEYQFLGFTPDGNAWGFREITSGPALVGFALVDWISGQERSRLSEAKGPWQAVLSPDGKVVAGIDAHGKVRLWDAGTGKVLGTLATRPTDYFGFLTFSPDSKTLATAGFPPRLFGTHVQDTPEDYRANLTLWDVATRKELNGSTLRGKKADLGMPTTPNRHEAARSMRFTPDGRRLAVACRVVIPGQGYPQTVLRLWDVPGMKEAGQFQSEEYGSLRDYSFAPDGKTVALVWMGAIVSQGPGEPTVYAPAPVTIREVATGKEVARIPPPRGGYAAVAFSPDGTLLATQDNHGVVKLWERTSPK